MNSIFKHSLLLLGIIFFLMHGHALFGQNAEFSFDQEPIDEILRTFEEESAYIFNYDPRLLREHEFNGKLDISDVSIALAELLYDSPFEFKINEKTILIYTSEPTPYRLCGYILDSLDRVPLIAANVILANSSQGVQTDGNGFFEFTVDGIKNERILISYIGYAPRYFQLQEFNTSNCDAFLLAVDKTLLDEEIIITDRISEEIAESESFGGHKLNYEKLSKEHSIVEHDVFKNAQVLPGIVSIDESASNIQIRGSTADQNLILWEGVALYQQAHLFGMVSAINPFSVDEVNIYKSSYDPKYDSRVGGLIDISMSDAIKDKMHGSAGLTLTEAHLNLEIPIISDQLALIASGRKGLATLYNSPPIDNYTSRVFQFSKVDDQASLIDEELLNVDQHLDFYDWNAKIIYRPSKKLLFTAGVYENAQDFAYDYNVLSEAYGAVDSLVTKTKAYHGLVDWRWNDKWTSTVTYSLSKYNNQQSFDEAEGDNLLTDYEQENDINDESIVISTEYEDGGIKLNYGYDYNVKRVQFNLLDTNYIRPFREIARSEQGRFHNLFASLQAGNERIKFCGGFRASYYEEKSRWYSSPRFDLQFNINKGIKLKVNGGIFHQFISQTSAVDIQDIGQNNPLWIINQSASAETQRAQKISAGSIIQGRSWLIDIEGYLNKTTGISSLSPNNSPEFLDEFTQGSSVAKGIDLLIKKRFGRLSTWANYSLGKVTYDFSAFSDERYPGPTDIRHVVSLVGSYPYKQFRLTLTGNYHSGLPFSKPIGPFSEFNEESQDIEYYFDYPGVNNARLKEYVRLDASLNYRSTIGKKQRLRMEITASYLNILQRQNEVESQFFLFVSDDGSEAALINPKKFLLNATPLLMCRIYW